MELTRGKQAMNKVIGYFFLLALFLIGVAYFAGFVADTKAVGSAVNTLLQTATGRNAAGNFAAYPTGAQVALQPSVTNASTKNNLVPTQVNPTP